MMWSVTKNNTSLVSLAIHTPGNTAAPKRKYNFTFFGRSNNKAEVFASDHKSDCKWEPTIDLVLFYRFMKCYCSRIVYHGRAHNKWISACHWLIIGLGVYRGSIALASSCNARGKHHVLLLASNMQKSFNKIRNLSKKLRIIKKLIWILSFQETSIPVA